MKEEAKRSENLREFWIEKLQECQSSDLTGLDWCCINQLPYLQLLEEDSVFYVSHQIGNSRISLL